MENLLEYNAFGILSITQKKISASVTAVYGRRSITRSAIEELDSPLDTVESDESIAVIFGVWMEEGKHNRVTMHEIGTLKSEVIAADIPEVKPVVNKAIELVRDAIEHLRSLN